MLVDLMIKGKTFRVNADGVSVGTPSPVACLFVHGPSRSFPSAEKGSLAFNFLVKDEDSIRHYVDGAGLPKLMIREIHDAMREGWSISFLDYDGLDAEKPEVAVMLKLMGVEATKFDFYPTNVKTEIFPGSTEVRVFVEGFIK